MERLNIFLHGFLGGPKDWQALADNNQTNWFYSIEEDIKELKEKTSFSTWTDLFIKKIPKNKKIHLYAYSMGGRLALHAILKKPELFYQTLLFSSHYGLETIEDKESRLASDNAWIKKINDLSWSDFLKEWNQQSVFNNDMQIEYKENKSFATDCLRYFSLSKQDFLLPKIESSAANIIWVYGENDKKFIELSKKLNPNKVCVLESCGHRIPWSYKDPKLKKYNWTWHV